MDETSKFELIYIPIVWIVGIVATIILYFCSPSLKRSQFVLGFILGIITSLMSFALLMKYNRKFGKKARAEDITWRKTLLQGYGLRLLLAGGVFACVVFNQDRFNLILAIIGYLFPKIVLIIYVLIRKGVVGSNAKVSE